MIEAKLHLDWRGNNLLHFLGSTKALPVIIIGDGIAGCATALALASLGNNISLLVLDDADPGSFKIGESLPAEARRILPYLHPNVLSQLEQDTFDGIHTKCTGTASAWGSSELQESFTIMNPFGSSWHLDRAGFDESLRSIVKSVCEKNKNNKLEKIKFTGVEKSKERWTVFAKDPGVEQQYQAKWLVDASGRKASLGRAIIKNDSLFATYAFFTSLTTDSDHRTLIESTETGWWYTSQLSNQTRVVVYHTDNRNPSSKQARKWGGFLDLLHGNTQHISDLLSGNDYQPVLDGNFPRGTPACSSYLEPPGDENQCWIAVGDAAMAFDPLSSQGMITAMKMGLVVARTISRNLKTEPQEVKDVTPSFKETFASVISDYERKKKYFYSQTQFSGEFWKKRS
ncbi:hypothetical protein Clacol_005168 [Clathrus columnatus]|uniref:FAD-binding domain-containing protein n=1 Tax=Clathrus columnatus TaxID=1419009 RepID=A0AAV5ACL9_9AGAM|nr:hypothetical protein Clacol_005168 [Clathrus columnatus]